MKLKPIVIAAAILASPFFLEYISFDAKTDKNVLITQVKVADQINEKAKVHFDYIITEKDGVKTVNKELDGIQAGRSLMGLSRSSAYALKSMLVVFIYEAEGDLKTDLYGSVMGRSTNMKIRNSFKKPFADFMKEASYIEKQKAYIMLSELNSVQQYMTHQGRRDFTSIASSTAQARNNIKNVTRNIMRKYHIGSVSWYMLMFDVV